MNGSVSIARNTSIAFSTALSPSHGVELCAARPWTTIRITSTPLACTPMCRSVGSPVIAKSPPRPCARPRVGRALVELLGLLVGHADEPHADRVLVVDVLQRAHHRRQAALHVVGAAADQPVALDPRLELLGSPGTTSRWPWKTTQGASGRAAARLRRPARAARCDRGRAPRSRGIRATLDESCGGDEIVGPRGVVADQPLGQVALVDHQRPARSLARSAILRNGLPAALVALGHAAALGVLAGLLELVLGLLQALLAAQRRRASRARAPPRPAAARWPPATCR